MKRRIAASLAGSVILLGSLGVYPAHADELHPLEQTLERNAAVSGMKNTDRDLLANTVDEALVSSTENDVELSSGDGEIVVHETAEEPIQIVGSDGTVALGVPFAAEASEPEALRDGVIAYENGNDTSTVRTVKKDGTVQTATIIDSNSAPERFDYPLTLPAGAVIEELQGGLLVRSAEGELIGGFTPAWATDANGKEVATRYEVNGSTLTQIVDHHNADIAYPVVADPAYGRGMIHAVIWERWAKRGWELRLQVTALARWTQPINARLVATEGLKDLRQHHPRSMASATMAQQWECHVVGLPGTINIDLESYRRSLPDWHSRILPSIIKRNPAAACNW